MTGARKYSSFTLALSDTTQILVPSPTFCITRIHLSSGSPAQRPISLSSPRSRVLSLGSKVHIEILSLLCLTTHPVSLFSHVTYVSLASPHPLILVFLVFDHDGVIGRERGLMISISYSGCISSSSSSSSFSFCPCFSSWLVTDRYDDGPHFPFCTDRFVQLKILVVRRTSHLLYPRPAPSIDRSLFRGLQG